MRGAGVSIIFALRNVPCISQFATTEVQSCDHGICQHLSSVTSEDILPDELILDEQAAGYLSLIQKAANFERKVNAEQMMNLTATMHVAKTTEGAPLAHISALFFLAVAAIAILIPVCMVKNNEYVAFELRRTGQPTTKSMWLLIITFQVLMLVMLFLLGAMPTISYWPEAAQNIQLYNYLIGVSLMMFVGFGYLMTFNHWYGLGAVGFTMLITCLGVQWAVIVEPLCTYGFAPFTINLMSLLNGNFAVAAILISFGGIIGKVDPSQLVVLTFLETICYCLNKVYVLTNWLDIADCGGTIVIHMFGAFFGLTVSLNLGVPEKLIREKSCATSDIFAFIGTVFLWLYWPSFVAGALPPGSVEADTALTNTILALLGSTIATFALSPYFSSKLLRPVDIQNATLAGGVAIGAVANLNIGPMAAVFIGCLAGELSTIGYYNIQGALADTIGLHDSCGIHNLHGMPSVLGGLASVLVPLLVEQGDAGRLGKPLNQLAGIVITILVACVTGTITSVFMGMFKDNAEAFNDSNYWEVAEDFDEKHTTASPAQMLLSKSGSS